MAFFGKAISGTATEVCLDVIPTAQYGGIKLGTFWMVREYIASGQPFYALVNLCYLYISLFMRLPWASRSRLRGCAYSIGEKGVV
jgi:hypothetical protein